MSTSVYGDLVMAGAPKLQPGLHYRITFPEPDGERCLRVRIVKDVERRWGFRTKEKTLGEAWETDWWFKRSRPDVTTVVAVTCRRAYEDWQAKLTAREAEQVFGGRHP